jgi:PAS domain S-box-containing protein
VIPAPVRRRTLEQSFAVTTTLLVILVIGATTLVVQQRMRGALERGLAGRGLAIARSIAAVATPSLLAYNYAALQLAANGAVEDPALVYVVIHDKEGGAAGVAGSPPSAASMTRSPADHQEATTRQIPVLTDDKRQLTVLEAVVPVRVEGVAEPWGTVRVGLSFDSVEAELKRLEVGLGISGVLLALLAIAVSRWMARRTTAPLRELVQGTVALSLGDTTYRIPVSGVREIAELGQAFNKMMDRVQEKAAESEAYQNQLGALNATLEQQVSQRTRALEESEVQYRTLVQHSPDSILIVQGGQVRFVNQAFQETFGITKERAASPNFRLESLFPTAHATVVAERIRAWESGEPASPAEIEATDAQGRPRELELRGSRIEYLGRPAAECLLIDMTETRRLREKLHDTERLRSLGELASGVAHDFNNLLGAILGRTQLLRRKEFPTEVDRDLAVVEKAAMDGRETVRRIQEFSRLRTDRPLTPVDLGQVIEDAIEITRTRWEADAARRNVSLQVVGRCDPVPPILGNGSELREVYTNLIINAVDAMPQGGRLTLRCMPRNGAVYSEVEDTGVGMTEEIRRHLFDPFFTTKGQGGTGLGMSVAYGIVRRHGGTIEVASTLGQGTKFLLEFPKCDAAALDVAASADAATSEAARPGRILVIDDEPSIAQLLEDALASEGHSVQIALSGRDGLEMSAVSEYDLVMTDLGMPDMSGWEVARALRVSRPNLPVVLVTGWGTTLSPDEVARTGISAVLHKPFEIKELLEMTHAVLRRSPVPIER